MKISLLGAGNRGIGYLRWIKFFFKKAEIESICDINIEKCNYASNKFRAKNRFYNPSDFFKKPGENGAIIIATQDKDHVKHALKAIDAGYKEILLEKPVSSDYKEIEGLLSYARERQANIVVCHVLRYTKYYEKLKEIVDSGRIGKVLTINHSENVGYFHYAHSYVRGNWSRGDLTSPFILAKCSHDFDLFHYILSDDCVSLSSYGDLSYFKKENAPEDSAERCIDCTVDCPYNAFRLYIKDPILKSTFLKFMGPTITGLPKPNKEDKINALKTGPYGRCVYKCDNNVCDHQIVSMTFKSGTLVTHSVSAFSDKFFRETHIMGSLGEIIGNDRTSTIKVNIFHKKSYSLTTKPFFLRPFGHTDGDINLIKNWYKMINSLEYNESCITYLSDTLESQKMAIAAEYSRLHDGEVVNLNK